MREKYVSIDIEKERMKAAFNVIDTNKDGYISRQELHNALLLNNKMTPEEMQELESFFEVWDVDGDGKINYSGE